MMRVFGVILPFILLSCGGGDPVDRSIAHQQAINKIIRDNMDDPDAAIKAVNDYMVSNREDIRRLGKEMVEMRKGMSMDQIKEIFARMKQTGKESAEIIAEFQKKHPRKLADLAKVMRQ